MGEALSTLDMVTILTKFMQESEKVYGFQSQMVSNAVKNGSNVAGNNPASVQGVKVSQKKDFNLFNMMLEKQEGTNSLTTSLSGA